MTRRDNSLVAYVSEELKAEVKQRADDEGETTSEYLNRIIRRQIQMEAEDAISSEIRAEERIEELVSIATDEVQQATEEMRDLNAKTGTYAAANFELLKEGRKDSIRRDALAPGSRRMRTDLDIVQENLDNSSQSDDAEANSMMDRMKGDE